jgi:hypothetical protein
MSSLSTPRAEVCFGTPNTLHMRLLLIELGIIAKNLLSPSVAVVDGENWGRKAEPGELPELRHASEMYWGFWVRDNPNIKNLRVYGAYNIINDATVLLVARAFKNAKVDKLTPWLGASFDATSDEGKALIGKRHEKIKVLRYIPNPLIGSPVGATIAHLLIGHKAELGIKRISKVIIVTNEAPKKAQIWRATSQTPPHVL